MENIDRYDLNEDGKVTQDEIDKIHKIRKFENTDSKADAQRKMTWITLIGMLLYPVGMVICAVMDMELASNNLAEIAPTYFLATAGVIAAFFGAEAWKVK